MATFITYTEEQQKIWDDWVAGRPQVVRDMCASHPANKVYRNVRTNQLVTLMSYNEDGTVQVFVVPELNKGNLFTGHAVFGVAPANLVECDIPPGTNLEKVRA